MSLEINALNKSFGEKHVLQDVSFQAQKGVALGLLGRNGAGKTTTIRIIMDVFPSDSGSVTYDGKPLRGAGVSFGYLPEERGLYPKKKIGAQLTYLAMLRGMDRRSAAAATKKWLEKVELLDYIDKNLETLSKGNQQKVQLASALMTNPEIAILDEPFSGLDPVNAQLLKDIVRDLVKEGKTVLFSSHQMSYVEQFCENIAILHQGRIVLDGNLQQIKRSYPRDRVYIESLEPSDVLTAKVKDFISSHGLSSTITSASARLSGCELKLSAPEVRTSLMKIFAESPIQLERYEVLEPTLEEIFVEKAGEGA